MDKDLAIQLRSVMKEAAAVISSNAWTLDGSDWSYYNHCNGCGHVEGAVHAPGCPVEKVLNELYEKIDHLSQFVDQP